MSDSCGESAADGRVVVEAVDETIPPGNVFARRFVDVTATQMDEAFVVACDESVCGKAGDWLVQSVEGELSVVSESVFREFFDPRSIGALEEFREAEAGSVYEFGTNASIGADSDTDIDTDTNVSSGNDVS